MEYEPTIRSRNIAEPRTFVTKWEKELNDKASRKKAFSRERDTKRGENFIHTQYEDICDYAQLIGLDDDDFYMTYNEDDENMLIKMWKMSMNRYTKDENQKEC
jgi:hypothetical protein